MTFRHFFEAWPPSMNHTWRSGGGRTYLDPKVSAFRERIWWEIVAARAAKVLPRAPLAGDVSVKICFYPPTAQRRDLDNLLKCTFDAFTHAGVWQDDSQVKHIDARMCDACPKNGGFWAEVTATGE